MMHGTYHEKRKGLSLMPMDRTWVIKADIRTSGLEEEEPVSHQCHQVIVMGQDQTQAIKTMSTPLYHRDTQLQNITKPATVTNTTTVHFDQL